MEFLNFTWIDYTLFAFMFGLSGAVGIYFGCCGKQDTATDYLLGGKKMKVFPVAMSLVASTLSGISLLGIPAEIYMFGSQYWMMCISVILMGFLHYSVYLPVFYKLQLTSAFEYLELRFDTTTRKLGSALFTLANFIGLPVIIYAPSLAFNHVTGYDLHIIAPVMSLICIFYTSIGGLKAVVWTDTLQFSVTLCTLGCVLVMGTISVGGVQTIWEKSELGGRLEFFNMSLDPTIRNTFWNILLGNFFGWTFFVGVNPATVQRFLAVPTLKDSVKVLIIFVIFTVITKSISCFSGLIMYAKYMDCDPLHSGKITKSDQILPYYVLDVASQIPGLSGLFVAGLFSTALSTLSTFLNTLSGTMYTDFIEPFMPASTTERMASNIMKLLTVLIGVISVALIFVVERLGSILQLVLSLNGVTGGPLLGLFTLGMLFPFANKKGALFGAFSAIAFMSLIVVKNQIHVWNGEIVHQTKPFYTYGCDVNSTATSILNVTESTTMSTSTSTFVSGCQPEEPHWLFRMSFHYYMVVGTLITIIVGLLASWITRREDDRPVNPDYISPCVHRFLTKSTLTMKYEMNDKAAHILELQENITDPSNEKLLKQ